MNDRPLKNVAASVHQRLLNVARVTGRPFNEVLQYFAMERYLYRLNLSPHSDSFVLKGALLFRLWDVPDSRATRDIDFLAYLNHSPENLAAIAREVCAIKHPDDGLSFNPDSVRAQRIKEDADYEGVRVRFLAQLGNARITMQTDIGFGDLIHPEAVQADYPAILDLPIPSLRMYPPETVIAEKAQAMVHLGTLNSRMKDFYDIWRMSQQFTFHGNVLGEAIRRTFGNRKTEIVSLGDLIVELLDDEKFGRQWPAFLQKSRLDGPPVFADVIDQIEKFLSPVFEAILISAEFDKAWQPSGPWGRE